MRVRSWETILRSTSPPALSLLGAMESISSMKMMDGAFFSASSNAYKNENFRSKRNCNERFGISNKISKTTEIKN
jgi:hypothetical protein